MWSPSRGAQLYLDGFASFGFGDDQFALDRDDLSLTGNYDSSSFLIGGDAYGEIGREGYEIRAELSLAYGRTDIGTVKMTATASGDIADLLAQVDGANYAAVSVTRLCCTNRVTGGPPLFPDGLIPQLQFRVCRAR